MKRILILMLALSVLLGLCACGSSAPANEGSSAIVQNNDAPKADAPADEGDVTDDAPAAAAGFVFTANGVDISMNAPAADILATLGEPKSYTEQASCAFEGLDKTYFFGSFYLQTYPGTEGDCVYSLWLVDDTVTTAEGIYIGSSQQEVENAYGADTFDGANSFTVTKGDSILTIILENGVVSSIQYDAVLA